MKTICIIKNDYEDALSYLVLDGDHSHLHGLVGLVATDGTFLPEDERDRGSIYAITDKDGKLVPFLEYFPAELFSSSEDLVFVEVFVE